MNTLKNALQGGGLGIILALCIILLEDPRLVNHPLGYWIIVLGAVIGARLAVVHADPPPPTMPPWDQSTDENGAWT